MFWWGGIKLYLAKVRTTTEIQQDQAIPGTPDLGSQSLEGLVLSSDFL